MLVEGNALFTSTMPPIKIHSEARLNKTRPRDIIDGPQQEPSSIPRQLPIDRAYWNFDIAPQDYSHVDFRNGDHVSFKTVAADFPKYDPAKVLPQTPLAYQIFEKYLKRDAFWRAVTQMHVPPLMAGEIFLGLKKTPTYDTYKELEGYADGGSDAPLEWFRHKFVDGLARGKIRPARETEPGTWANAFYIALAGGPTTAVELRDEIGTWKHFDIRERYAMSDDVVEREVIRYMIGSMLFLRLQRE
jgi:hypothetical protein